jgi:hypothetical protein
MTAIPTENRYRYLATSPQGFVQQLSRQYVTAGYRFWVGGVVPEGKDPRFHDNKILNRYPVELTKSQRSYRRRMKGEAGLQYLRWESHWILIAEQGKSVFFDLERENFRDIRERSFMFCGYSIGSREGRAHVAISKASFLELAREAKEEALRRPPAEWRRWFWDLPYESHGPVIKQFFDLLRTINEMRKAAGQTPLPNSFVRRFRKPVLVFD